MVKPKLSHLSPLASLASGGYLRRSRLRRKSPRTIYNLPHLRDGVQPSRVEQPSILYLMSVPSSRSLKASNSKGESIMLNSVGARTQPCSTPLVVATHKVMQVTSKKEVKCLSNCVEHTYCTKTQAVILFYR